MPKTDANKTAIITGASGQDGYFLAERLLREGWEVHAVSRRPESLDFPLSSDAQGAGLRTHRIDLLEDDALAKLIAQTQPAEFYNLAGQSSVSKSFSDPIYTWRTNAEAVVYLLDAIRTHSPHTRFYQASSTDMFGVAPHGLPMYGEDSPLHPQSPYASAKAAAHLLCHAYREVFGLRITSGILSNHESHRRSLSFLSRKVVDHVVRLKANGPIEPLAVGNLKVERDWGFAPDYVEGICRILRQIQVRADVAGNDPEADTAPNYRDYVLATGETHAVWELVDRAFALAGFSLDWQLEDDDPARWQATFRENGKPAVVVDRELLRRAEPKVIKADPSRARRELGWTPRQGLDVFLQDMLSARREAAAAS
jgi:GDPmannose 4,6-dehydratase